MHTGKSTKRKASSLLCIPVDHGYGATMSSRQQYLQNPIDLTHQISAAVEKNAVHCCMRRSIFRPDRRTVNFYIAGQHVQLRLQVVLHQLYTPPSSYAYSSTHNFQQGPNIPTWLQHVFSLTKCKRETEDDNKHVDANIRVVHWLLRT